MRLSPCRYNHANLFWLSEEDVGGNRRSGEGVEGGGKTRVRRRGGEGRGGAKGEEARN